MSDGLKDILSNLNKDIEQEKLLEYINEHLSESEKHQIEKQMMEDEFVNDAVEGLQAVENKARINELVSQLNADLKKQTSKKKRRRHKNKAQQQPWVYYAIIIIILLMVVGYLVIKRLN